MTLNRYATKPDGNQAEIIAALRAEGFVVWIIEWPVDLLVGTGNAWLPMEIKNGPKNSGKLTPDQRKFIAVGGGPISVVWDVPGALTAARSVRT